MLWEATGNAGMKDEIYWVSSVNVLKETEKGQKRVRPRPRKLRRNEAASRINSSSVDFIPGTLEPTVNSEAAG